jgi:hypothetical protein
MARSGGSRQRKYEAAFWGIADQNSVWVRLRKSRREENLFRGVYGLKRSTVTVSPISNDMR